MELNERVCRLCLFEDPAKQSDRMVHLNDDESTLNIIRVITSVEVIIDHTCQYYMCDECNTSLQNCYAFRERCIVNDDIFRRKFPMLKSETTDAVFLSVDVTSSDTPERDQQAKTETHRSESEENFIEECLVDKVQPQIDDDDDHDDLDEPKYEPPANVHNDSTGSDAPSLKVKKKVLKKRGRKIKEESDKSNNKLPCTQCGKMIARNNINQHLLTHDPDRPKVFCSYCGKAFKDPRRMQLHINSNHTLEKKYPCDICGKVYLRPTSLKDHKATKHTTDKRYECSECGMAFISWAQRWHHFKKEHTTAKPYACTYCDWAFKFKGDLTLHIRKHTGEKPFKCDICGKAFNKSYNVVIHKKSHRNVLPPDAPVPTENAPV